MLVYSEIGASMAIFTTYLFASNVCWIGQNTIATQVKTAIQKLTCLIDIAHTANNILYKLYTKMVVYF